MPWPHFCWWRDNPSKGPHYWGFGITLRHNTLYITPLNEWLARRRDVYWTTCNTRRKHPCPQRDSNPQPPSIARGDLWRRPRIRTVNWNVDLCSKRLFDNRADYEIMRKHVQPISPQETIWRMRIYMLGNCVRLQTGTQNMRRVIKKSLCTWWLQNNEKHAN
jgi:hypothetical protein